MTTQDESAQRNNFWDVEGFDAGHPRFTVCTEMADLVRGYVFDGLWARPGLDSRSRSLVTLGILIALRAVDELRVHFPIGLRNGLSVSEIEEVVYHATAYAGFPAAHAAMLVAQDVLGDRPGEEPSPGEE